MSPPEILVVVDTPTSDSPIFDPAEWISCGKTYPSADTPGFIHAARKAVLAIPTEHLKLLPDQTLSVLALLRKTLPPELAHLVTQEAQCSFDFEAPTDTLEALESRPLPPDDLVRKLQQAFGQAWFNGAQSLVDRRFKQSKLLLFVLTYWTEMGLVVSKKAIWKRAVDWLTRWEQDTNFLKEADRARSLMDLLPWSARIKALGSDTGAENLALLLSEQWLDDELINMLVQELFQRTHLDPKLSRTVALLPLPFQQVLHKAAAKQTYSHPLLERCKHYISGGRQRFYFPVNVGGVHWVSCMIDFEENVICYGDSMLSATRKSEGMQGIVEDIQVWLKDTLSIAFTDKGNSLAHGVQEDSSSCGVCSVNTIEHALFGTTLFTHRNRHLMRVQFFNQLDLVSSAPKAAEDLERKERSRDVRLGENHLETQAHDIVPMQSSSISCRVPDGSPASPTETEPAILPSFGRPTQTQMSPLSTTLSSPQPQSPRVNSAGPASTQRPSESTPKRKRTPPAHPSCFEDAFSESSCSSDASSTCYTAAKRRKSSTGCETIGLSSSATASRKLKQSMEHGTLAINAVRLERFKKTCREYDGLAQFRHEKKWQVLHTVCGKWYVMKEPYSAQRFREHVKKCPVRNPKRTAAAPDPDRREPDTGERALSRSIIIPCPGIRDSSDSRLSTYLHRTGAHGGDAPSVTAIAPELFGDKTLVYSALSEKEKELVLTEQQHQWAWRNDHTAVAVFSTACGKGLDTIGQTLCTECSRVLYSKVFCNALRVPVPEGHNYKFLNTQYRNETLGTIYTQVHGIRELLKDQSSSDSIFTRFAIMVHEGKFKRKGKAAFLDLVKAMVTLQEREERGVGKQNFNYGPALLEFSQTCSIISPELYRTMHSHFQLPAHRSLRRLRAKLPRFPMDIGDRTFAMVRQYLVDIGYGQGPVALSYDDTKLHAAWCTFYDSEKQTHFLVGGTGPPIAVANVDELREVLRSPEGQKKATKLRLWCLQPTLPKVPPLNVAAKAIPSNLTAEDLYTMLITIIRGLIQAGVNVSSYSADGTETERSVQKMLMDRSDIVREYTIDHPATGEAIPVRIAFISGWPIAIVQDSKHGAKTFRNNMCSGARTLPLGNYILVFSQLHEVAFSPGSPLYHRDVEKLDRQDDNAATRLYTSATLDHIIDRFPEYLGLIVYLFVFGELVDAYQNRSISHQERIKMVFRAKFFLDFWQKFLKKAGYPEQRYCISREAIDICNILVDGLIALVIIHRDYMGERAHPLLLWLLSTEICEHVFGECQKLVKDFTFLDFLYMVPRLSVLIRSACRFAQTSDPGARASGYAHTYFDHGDANLAFLSVFPSDIDITDATQEAWDEACNLWDLLGVNPPDLFSASTAAGGAPGPQATILPSITSWFSPGEDPVYDDLYDPLDDDCDAEEPSESDVLQQLIDAEQDAPLRTAVTEDRMRSLTCAAIALTLNDMSIKTLMAKEDVHAVGEAYDLVQDPMPIRSVPGAESIRPYDRPPGSHGIYSDLSGLVRVRKQHETERARKGVHTSKANTTDNERSSLCEESKRQVLIREMQQALAEEQDRGIGTGLERDAHWHSHVGTASKAITQPSAGGNSANAALIAGAKAASVRATHRLPLHLDHTSSNRSFARL
ncbi:hypothetical protein PYCCODRAFT_1379012 [Trametes coccinea BRFM310]|uniref:Ubiquitin-like protease family profile domain-containing protein n=1 Tax=Trametes coccinea (strain BRFM310) TaxID=1353009 RepID=A0A1Y2I7T0_TRAC3|nr:hypothetical protein PYCCODRAFT_1379012 [Trametes coccinea BRFM310]